MKKTLGILLVVVLAATLLVGGTVAYLTDREGVVNVMTIGDVEIDMIEQQRDENDALEPFEQDKPLYPAYYPGSSIPWAPADQWPVADDPAWKVVEDNESVVDKFVTVENTGKNNAYIRTVIALETDEMGADVHFVYNSGEYELADGSTVHLQFEDYTDPSGATYITVGDTKYYLFSITYMEPLAPGETTIPSLKQVYLDKAATDEECALYGDTYEILVYSQAVQAEGWPEGWTAVDALNESFGALSMTNHPWINAQFWDGSADEELASDAQDGALLISSAEELAGFAARVNAGEKFIGQTVKLTANIDLAYKEWTPIGTSGNSFQGVFDGNGYIISNLNVDVPDAKGAGLFGYVFCGGSNTAVVKNVKVVNADINALSHAGVIVGNSYGDIIDCSVENAVINCIDKAGEDGDKVGAIVGFTPSDVELNVTGNSAKDVSITANRDAGCIVGRAVQPQCKLEGNTWEDVSVVHSAYGTGANISETEVGRNN